MGKNKLIPFLFILALSLGSCFFLFKTLKIDTNIFNALSPEKEASDALNAIAVYESKIKNQFALLFDTSKLDEIEDKVKIGAKIHSSLLSSGLFNKILFKDTRDLSKIPTFYYKYKKALLTEDQKKLIKDKKFKTLEKQALEKIYSPFSSAAATLSIDPLALMGDFFEGMYNPARVSYENGYYITEDKKILIRGEIKESKEKEALDLLQRLEKKYSIVYSSMAFYGEVAKVQAENESKKLSALSLGLIFLFFLIFFKSFRHLGLGVIFLALCISLSLSITNFIFGSIHIITMLMGISVLGLVIDYFIHFFMEELDGMKTVSLAVSDIRKPLIYSFLTSATGFSIFYFSPLPILKQFSILGVLTLLFATLSTLFLLPMFYKSSMWARSAREGLNEKIFSKVFVFILCLFSLSLILKGNVSNDIQTFSKKDQKLDSLERKLKESLKLKPGLNYIVSKGKTEQALLENEEKNKSRVRSKGANASFISDWLPSLKSQKESLDLYKKLERVKKRILLKLGVKKNKTKKLRDEPKEEIQLITKELWESSIPSQEFNLQWVGEINENLYSVTPVFEKKVQQKNIYSRISILNTQLDEFSKNVLQGIGIFLLVISLLLSLLHGPIGALKIIFPVALASCVSLAAAALIFGNIVVFHLLGVVLVITLGLDYSFFYFFNRDKSKTVAKAIMLSVLTTLSSFGVLFLSSTTAVQAFGTTVFIGVFVCWLLVPISRKARLF